VFSWLGGKKISFRSGLKIDFRISTKLNLGFQRIASMNANIESILSTWENALKIWKGTT
jgi:hypothetical protein